MRRSVLFSLGAAVLVTAAPASPKPKKVKGEPRALTEIEAKVTALEKTTDARADFDALTSWLNVPVTCATDACDSLGKAKWLTGNLDTDADDEKILALVTRGTGSCAPASLEVFVLDPMGKTDFKVVGHTRLALTSAKEPIAEASLAAVHSSALKDLVVRVDGQCTTREQIVRVFTLETGRLEELAASDDSLGTSLVSHSFTGTPPATIEWVSTKGKTKLTFDDAHGYDAFPSYADAKKTSLSGSDDASLGPTECAGPLGSELALDCGLAGNARLEVMVQNGRATGMTVSATPADRSFVRCVRKKLASATWKSVAAASGCTRTFALK